MSKRNKGGKSVNTDNGAAGVAPEGNTSTTEQPTAEAAPAVDPFADVPVVHLADGVEFDDLTDVAVRNADPRKYGNVHAAAHGDRLPTAKGWKYERAMLTPGTNRKEFKAGSVYGTIQAIVQAAGRGGLPAYVLATKLRKAQIGNKRSHYCDGLPPIGWAEGWINTAVTKSIAGVHPTKQAPALRDEVTDGEANVNKAEEQGKLTANG
jgi:hypothetical protein